MLLILNRLEEKRANEMRGVKPIILMGIGHDLQETFIPGRGGDDQGLGGANRGDRRIGD